MGGRPKCGYRGAEVWVKISFGALAGECTKLKFEETLDVFSGGFRSFAHFYVYTFNMEIHMEICA